MKVIECFTQGKSAARECEDLVVVTDDFAAVIDGATDESGVRFAGKAGGRFAAEVLGAAVEELPRETDAHSFAEALTAALGEAVRSTAGDLSDDMRWPVASLVCVSSPRREVWRIGDCNAVIDGVHHLGGKRVDDAAYGFRAAVNAALLARGTPLDEILETDPGAEAARPLYELQQHLANRVGPWGFGCVDGRTVPAEFVEVFGIPETPCEVVLTSDGYAQVLESLAATEARLHAMIEADPAAINELWAMGKSLRPGYRALDDRAFLRLGFNAFVDE